MDINKAVTRAVVALLATISITAGLSACGKNKDVNSAESSASEEVTASEDLEIDKQAEYEKLYREYMSLTDEYVYYRELAAARGAYERGNAIEEYELNQQDVAKRMRGGTAGIAEDINEEELTLEAYTDYDEYAAGDLSDADIPEVSGEELDSKILELKDSVAELEHAIEALKNSMTADIPDPVVMENYRSLQSYRNGEVYNDRSGLGDGRAEDGDAGSDGLQDSNKSSKSISNVNTNMTVEEIFRAGGWTIVSGSGDIVSATKNFGEDMIDFDASDYGVYASATNIYGDYVGMSCACDTNTKRKLAITVVGGDLNALEEYPANWTFTWG